MKHDRGCRVPGCAAPHCGKGFCDRHLRAFNRGRIDAEGDPVRTQCERCHELFVATRSDKRFCPPCAPLRAQERYRAWRAENPEKVKALQHAHYIRHRDEIGAKTREYHRKNREAMKAKQREYWHRNRERLNVKTHKYRERNRERLNAKQREYYRKNRETLKAKSRARYQDMSRVFQRARGAKNKVGRPAVKRQMFLEAKRLRDTENVSWPEIARRLDPNGFKENPRKAGERIRLGVTSLSQTKASPPVDPANA